MSLKQRLRNTPFVHEVRVPMVARVGRYLLANPLVVKRVAALNPGAIVVEDIYVPPFARELRWFWERWL